MALAKFLNNKRCPQAIYEAMECLGGVGYVEEGPMPLLYREAPLNSIWEGSRQRDLPRRAAHARARRARRATASTPSSTPRAAATPPTTPGSTRWRRRWPGPAAEAEARWFVERLATLLAAAVLLRAEVEPVAEAYVATRVAGEGGRIAGAWPKRLDRAGLIARAMPC